MQVLIGTNQFVDCDTLIAIGGRPLLKVAVNPLRVTLITPPEIPSRRVVTVSENASTGDGLTRVIHSAENVSIFWGPHFLLAATLVQQDEVNVHVDLRPVGINIYDDATGFHVGNQMHFSGNTMLASPVAIALS